MSDIKMDIARKIYEEDICLNIRKASRFITRFYDGYMKECGIRISQFNMMLSILINPSSNLNELGDILLMDRTTVTRNLNILHKNGLIFEIPVKSDKRCMRYGISKEGNKVMQKALSIVEKIRINIEGDKK